MRAVDLQSQQLQHRGAHVGMIAEECSGLSELVDAGPDYPEPGRCNLRLNIAMVPGESVVDADQAGIRWNIGAEVRRLSRGVEEEIRIAEVGEVRRPKWVRGNHVQQ